MSSIKTKRDSASTIGEESNVVEFPGIRTPKHSEDDIALRFAARFAKRLQYIDERGKWALWDGERWQLSSTSAAFARARRVCRDAANECQEGEGRKRALVKAQTVAAVERLARVDHRLLSHADEWDADPWLLNTPDGVVDLKTGNVRDHDPRYRMTKITKVGPRNVRTPLWKEFLKRITDGDITLRSFLHRMSGYSLTGVTIEHALFFHHGAGANGKGVMMHTLAGIMGDYHIDAPMEVFVESRWDRHSTELARLHGARLVTANETERGRRWAEARIKMLTGGDPVTARFMRQDDFTYVPQFKLMFSGNHKPALRSVDEAIRRRFHLVPFEVTIPERERDANLPKKLEAEWGGILHWMIEGCLDWQDRGLRPPQSVIDATTEYLKGEDNYALWMDEFGTRNPDAFTERTKLFESWRSWAGQNNVGVGHSNELYDYLRALDFMRETARMGRR